MNERIRDILKQATQYADSLGPIDGAEWCDAEYSKFAELLIRECASQCLLTPIDHALLGEVHANRIKQHFGVG